MYYLNSKRYSYEINSIVENKADIMQHVLKIQKISLLSKHMKWIPRGVFLRVFTFGKADL